MSMKRKTLVTIFALLVGALYGFAQNNTVIWGVKASVDAELPSKWHGAGGSFSMYRPGCGFSIGGVSNIYLGKNFYLEPGLSLAYSQYRYKDLSFMDSQGIIRESDPKIYKWGFQIPVVVGYTIDLWEKSVLNVFTGPQIRYAFAGKIAFKDKELANDANEYINLWNGQRRFDLSWKVGVGVPVINDLQISLEADLGITDLLKSDLSFRENRLGLCATYYF